MEKIKAQKGISATADFSEKTWTFCMDDDFRVSAGEFVIIPKEYFDSVVSFLHAISVNKELVIDCDIIADDLLKQIL